MDFPITAEMFDCPLDCDNQPASFIIAARLASTSIMGERMLVFLLSNLSFGVGVENPT